MNFVKHPLLYIFYVVFIMFIKTNLFKAHWKIVSQEVVSSDF